MSDRMKEKKSEPTGKFTLVHQDEGMAQAYYDKGIVPWWQHFGQPKITGGEHTHSGYPTCAYCGSISVEDFLYAVEHGCEADPADRKYGYLHKLYVNSMPLKAGEYWRRTSTASGPIWNADKTKAVGYFENIEVRQQHSEDGKFYTRHLLEATPEQMERFNAWAEKRLGLLFWHAWKEGQDREKELPHTFLYQPAATRRAALEQEAADKLSKDN